MTGGATHGTLNPSLEPTPLNGPAPPDAIGDIIAYHDRTKHRRDRYAAGPGGLDWATQPNPFRRFHGAPELRLPLAESDHTPPAAVLFGVGTVISQPFNLHTLGLFFELSLGLSAKKQIADSSWFLRINPSSGNLHPTEVYAVLPSRDWLPGGAGVYHYSPLDHALEQRARRSPEDTPARNGFYVGLSSIIWREAWKYGERAFRYCQHDIGHALATICCAAAVLGWRVKLSPEWDDRQLATLLGLDRANDFVDAEQEIPGLLAEVVVSDSPPPPAPLRIEAKEWFGRANQLSRSQVPWPAIDKAVAASEQRGPLVVKTADRCPLWPAPNPAPCELSSGQLIRQRRSAVDFAAATIIAKETFLGILDATLPRPSAPPFDGWPLPPRLHLIVFVHRVNGLAPGMYLWLRNQTDEQTLRQAFRNIHHWEAPEGQSPNLPLRRLGNGDLRSFARTLSCQQDIAADGAFSLGMLAHFEPVLREFGASAWRQLFWEAGMIGQGLYLAAEAAGVRGTGIGCYFDDLLHDALGLTGHDWQSLYHFTVGTPVDDSRLSTAPPYAHLKAVNA